MDPGHVVRPVGVEQAGQEVGHAPGRGGVLALGGAQRPRDHREEGAIDQSVAVHQEEPRRRPGGRRTRHEAPRRTRARTRSYAESDSEVSRNRLTLATSSKTTSRRSDVYVHRMMRPWVVELPS